MCKLFAVGDIHGNIDRLDKLLKKVGLKKNDKIIFLGDYIDRGHDSFTVIERLIELKNKFENVITLRGNHEDYVISLFMGNQDPQSRMIWTTKNGGDKTLNSYRRAGKYLKHHRRFYESLPIFFETDKYFFCHAGVVPGIPLSEQRSSDMLTIRERFLNYDGKFEKIIIHGHTAVERLLPEPQIRNNRIGLDTGCGRGGFLTAIELQTMTIYKV